MVWLETWEVWIKIIFSIPAAIHTSMINFKSWNSWLYHTIIFRNLFRTSFMSFLLKFNYITLSLRSITCEKSTFKSWRLCFNRSYKPKLRLITNVNITTFPCLFFFLTSFISSLSLFHTWWLSWRWLSTSFQTLMTLEPFIVITLLIYWWVFNQFF